MADAKQPARRRIGQVSLYAHHGSRYTYHREDGRPVRRRALPSDLWQWTVSPFLPG